MRRGAVVASGIYVAYARALAALLYQYWPMLTRKILRHLQAFASTGVENCLPTRIAQEELRAASRPFWDRPPWMPVRALRVAGCGWSSLSSADAIERVVTPQPSSLQTHRTETEYESSGIT